MGLLSVGLLGCVAYDLPFTLSFLCNEAYINKIRLFPSIFVLGPSKVSYMVHSWDLVCGLLFVNLMLSLDLCARMLGWLGAKICKALRVGSKDVWLVGSQNPQCPMFSLSVVESLRIRLACLIKGQVSIA